MRKQAAFRPPMECRAVFKNLSGGLNLRELEYRMDQDQSPEMQNLWWHDGLLGCRDGQEWISKTTLGRGLTCYERLYWGHMIAHIGDGLYVGKPGASMTLQKLCGGLPLVRGTFLPYQESLIYKTKGVFKKITWTDSGFEVKDVEPYVPVTVINCTASGSGDLYQPENRLSPKKTVWYTVQRETRGVSFTANGVATEFRFDTQDKEPIASVEQVYVGTTLQGSDAYTVSADNKVVTLKNAPPRDMPVSVVYTVGVRVYHLPVKPVDSIVSVTLDGEAVTDYQADLQAGTITFPKAPAIQNPPQNNTLHVTYQKADADAVQSIMDCTYGAVYGGAGGAVLVLAGSEKQPNAYFWNGSHIRMDPGYFPVDSYNLAGDNLEAVTGFGEQAGFLIVLKEHSVGRCLLGTSMIGDRAHLTLDYTPVNGIMGCDLPWTIRLVDNNLLWCSTDFGVCRLEDTTQALENQVICMSRMVNGGSGTPGLLEAVRTAETVCALEDGERYWVCAGGEVYLWDHALSSASRPSWFYFTDIDAVAFFRGDTMPVEAGSGLPFTGARRVYHLDGQGRVTRFTRNFRDYGRGIEKVYRFPAQSFGTYEQRKHIKKIILATRSDTDTVMQLQYETDFGVRKDPTPIPNRTWRLVPRNLAFRYLAVSRFAHVAVRKPGCRHVRHFSLRLENREPGCDMSIVSAEMVATIVEKER